MFTDPQRLALIAIARAAVIAQVMGQRIDPPAAFDFPAVAGAFVTLKRHGQLRGCLGTVECRRPLAEEVASCAASAARSDPRFSPVQPIELDDLDIEVSVLGPLERIDPRDPDAITIGRHGLVIEQDGRRGLLLPQVAVEWGWTRDQFLSQTCRKAGLRANAWQQGACVYRFDADVFGG
jgi:AmmeMemoRadiSam system protein A